MRLLIVEDNARLASLVADALARKGMTCDTAGSLDDADAALASASFDAILLDLGLPDGDGRLWLQARRRGGFSVPVLMLTARGALNDRVGGLDAGADDYLVKPAETEEIAARLRALLRRPGPRADTLVEVGPLRFDTAAQRAWIDGVPLELTRREVGLLELLMRHAGSVVRRQQIENALYSFDEEVSPNAVDAVVSRLRRRLDENGARHMLHTIRGLGYLLEERAP
ncbi:response regulator transcription factor [Novosphingobium sp. KCTC 2891]|uniref:winged helix-turn-helix domain-containing protein n=1 Tax=Novosphingobium sp. KCTC 2891 TaxID=2989730 RepID=UPI002221844F|nr:response regulator transcription factor [Novosphingobium sp. KCTC 2891]MCW1382532.1 response regulator transcription factor [Novosphingobium sp. KCTC 2891]